MAEPTTPSLSFDALTDVEGVNARGISSSAFGTFLAGTSVQIIMFLLVACPQEMLPH
jgi:hypothetical protein